METSKPKLLVSVSGGRTSGLMAYLLWKRFQDKYDLLFVFANTSREDDRTLDFVHQLEINFGMPIVWVEAVVHHGQRKGSTHRVVDYRTADTQGGVFEEVIKKYGLPSVSFPHCTRELKANPIKSYARSIGWTTKDYQTVIGYRADEPKRVNMLRANKKRQWYPLYEWGIKKADVAAFWKAQSFDLQLEDWEGNCRLCYKKSDRKLFTQIVKDPESTRWNVRMELNYGFVAPRQYQGPLPMKSFRHHRSITDMIDESRQPFTLATDKSMLTDGADYDFDLDEQESCAESCEPF